MVENYLLKELVALARYKTLAAAAKQLGISQPAITRGMQKLEDELNLKLLERTPNRVHLTETGKFAVQEAQKALTANHRFSKNVQQYYQTNTQIRITAVAPSPMRILKKARFSQPLLQQLQYPLINPVVQLLNKQMTCIVTTAPLHHSQIASTFLGQECLGINVPITNPLSQKQFVSFHDLIGTNILVLAGNGIWDEIIRQYIPKAQFIEEEINNFNAIKDGSSFPYFVTNIAAAHPDWKSEQQSTRVNLKISDPQATMSFYVNYLTSNQQRMAAIIQAWQQEWTQYDNK